MAHARGQRWPHDGHARGRDEHGGAGHLARGVDPAREGARGVLHGREPRRGRIQPRCTLEVRSDPRVLGPISRRRGNASQVRAEPRNRYLHPREGGHGACRGTRARPVPARHLEGDEGDAIRVPGDAATERRVEGALRDRSEGLLDARGG